MKLFSTGPKKFCKQSPVHYKTPRNIFAENLQTAHSKCTTWQRTASVGCGQPEIYYISQELQRTKDRLSVRQGGGVQRQARTAEGRWLAHHPGDVRLPEGWAPVDKGELWCMSLFLGNQAQEIKKQSCTCFPPGRCWRRASPQLAHISTGLRSEC